MQKKRKIYIVILQYLNFICTASLKKIILSRKLLLRFEQPNGFLDLRDLEQGVYLIRVKFQGLETTLRVVKK